MHEREKRGASFWRRRAVDIGRAVSLRLGSGFVFPAKIDISVSLYSTIRPPALPGSCAPLRGLSFLVGARCCQLTKEAGQCCGNGRVPVRETSPVPFRHFDLFGADGIHGFAFLTCLACWGICFLQLHCRLRRTAAGRKIWRRVHELREDYGEVDAKNMQPSVTGPRSSVSASGVLRGGPNKQTQLPDFRGLPFLRFRNAAV